MTPEQQAIWESRCTARANRVYELHVNRNIIVTKPPELTRTIVVYTEKLRPTDYFERSKHTFKTLIQQMRQRGDRPTRIFKRWHVSSFNTSVQQWEDTRCALAHLEALRVLYAKWLLAKGTEAQGYV